ncbi:helix-turn-helix domain-containing protein [Streptomyces sp. NPDC048604]|uniref:helix-turn-helix domain-containing protein n=1 Tax=Streptomyces sp. NPDC048604 TaxID=3365578 RepID=UPI0037210EF7
MADHPNFGDLLTRLLQHRRIDVAGLSSASGIPEGELRAVVGGTPPSSRQLDALAPALGFHPEDLYVIAGGPVPEDRTPRDPAAGSATVSLIKITTALPPDQRARVHRLVDGLRPEPRVGPQEPLRAYDPERGGFGALLVNLLCGNRLGNSVPSAAKALALLTHGRVYLAASTVNGIGQGRVPLTADLVTGFAVTLGMQPGDLAALTGVELPEPPRPADPLTEEMAGLLWDCRRLTAEQAEHACEAASSLLVAVPEDAPEEDWNRVHRHHGTWWGAPRR